MSKMSSRFEKLFQKARDGDTFWAARAKLDFAVALNRLMGLHEISRTQLADKIGSSQAYVTKVLRGDTNFTIDTMVKLSRAAGGRLCVSIVQDHGDIRWVNLVNKRPSRTRPRSWASLDAPRGRNIGHVGDEIKTPTAA